MVEGTQGRGKASFREFKRDLRTVVNDIKQSIDSGFLLSPLDIQNLLDLAFVQYFKRIEEDDLPNPSKWINRGERETQKAETQILARYGMPPASPFVMPDTEDYEYSVYDEEEDFERRFSIPIITGSNRFIKAGVKARKRIIPPSEIDQYLSEVPYPLGIEPVYEDEVLKGFRVWVQD
jgi:hypothetical protein